MRKMRGAGIQRGTNAREWLAYARVRLVVGSNNTQLGAGRYGASRAMCTDCSGKGEKIKEKDQCKKCKGKKTVKEKTRQEIFVERGMVDRQRIVLTGAGDEEVS